MPRRTAQEVLVQDVQKRRNPNKHYVRRLFLSLGLCLLRLASLPRPGKVKTKEGCQVTDYRDQPEETRSDVLSSLFVWV